MTTPNRLFVQVFWGQTGTYIRSFGPEDGPLFAQARDDATVPVWGSEVADQGFTLAEPTASGFRLQVPAGATLERLTGKETYAPMTFSGPVDLKIGDRFRLLVGKTTILVSLETTPAAVGKSYIRAVLPILVLAATFFFPIYFLLAKHNEQDPRRRRVQELWRAQHEGLPELIRPGDEPPKQPTKSD
ncbi:MAG: hypothetical protein ACT4TC_05370 [Myxococcaceae bacterium]